MQSVAYDLPPVILSGDIQNLQLPCETVAWEARNEVEWYNAYRHLGYSSIRAGEALQFLLDDTSISEDPIMRISSFGSFILLLALIQRIFLARQLHTSSTAALPPIELNTLQ